MPLADPDENFIVWEFLHHCYKRISPKTVQLCLQSLYYGPGICL